MKKVRTSDLELKDRLVSIQRVTKVTKGGRTFSFSAIVVVGNENGVVGYGLGKASEVTSAIAKGVEDAKKNLVKIPVINGTIPHKQEMRFGGSLVMNGSLSAGGFVGFIAVFSQITRPACRAGVGRREERACQEQGFVEPPQPGEGYHRRSLRAARRSQRGTVARYLDESGV